MQALDIFHRINDDEGVARISILKAVLGHVTKYIFKAAANELLNEIGPTATQNLRTAILDMTCLFLMLCRSGVALGGGAYDVEAAECRGMLGWSGCRDTLDKAITAAPEATAAAS